MKDNLNIIYNIDSRRISEILSDDIRIQTTISSPLSMNLMVLQNRLCFNC